MSGVSAGGLPKSLEHDWRELSALLDHYGERQPIPCRTGIVPASMWTGDSDAEQALAAAECSRCPALVQCRRYGLTHVKESGVYGGLSESERRQVARELKETK